MIGQTDNLPLTEHFLDGVLDGAATFLVNNVKHQIHGLPLGFLQGPSCKGLGDGIQEGHGAVHPCGNYGVADAGECG